MLVIKFFLHGPSTRFFASGFTVVNKRNVVYVRITCGLGSSVSEIFTVCIFRRYSEDGDNLFPQNSIHSKLFCVCVEGNNASAFWIEMRSLN